MKCNHCTRKYAYTSSTTNMFNHLKQQHSRLFYEDYVTEKVELPDSAPKESQKGKIRSFLTKKSDLPFKRSCSFVKEMDRKLVRYIVTDIRPLDTVKSMTLCAC